MVHTSPDADDASIFMVLIKDKINLLVSSLHRIGDLTGLVTNCTKSQVDSIRCEGLDLDHILQAFPASRTNFPMKYLGLPLSVKRLKRIHSNLGILNLTKFSSVLRMRWLWHEWDDKAKL
jgi:hypothetical protein